MKAGGPSALGTGNVSISQYGALDLNGFSSTIGLLSSSVSTARVTNTGATDATLTLAGSGNQTFGGIIQDGAKKVSLLKTGPGTQILSGNNTYTGNTTMIQGGFQFTAGRLAFAPLENGVCNRITVGPAATVTLSGTFDFDLSKADFTSGNSWSLVVASTSTTTFGASFQVAGFTKSTAPGGNVWTKNERPRTWTFAESTGVLRLQISGYADWLTGFPSLADTAAGADPDYDGVANLLEYVLGGDPSLVNHGSSLFAANLVPEGMRFTFHRTDNSETGATLTFQYSRNLLVWADLLISATSGGPDASGVVFTVEENAAAADLVTVTVPADASGRIFGRLRAVTAP